MVLQGIKILDLATTAPGSFCTMILGDFGAEVLKVEAPRREGQAIVGSGHSPSGSDAPRLAAYHPLNRNKRSVILNLRKKGGQEAFFKLAKDADVIIESFRPGVVEQLMIDYPRIVKINPGVIYCSMSAYGQDSPFRSLPGHDTNFISFGGALSMIGPQEKPVLPLNLVGDYGGALFCTISILLALVNKERTGKGQSIDFAISDGVISMMAMWVYDYMVRGYTLKRGEDFRGGSMPWMNAYKTKDNKFISLGCAESHFWANLCRAIGREDFLPYQHDEGEKRAEIFKAFEEIFATRTRDEWFEILKDKNIPVSKVLEIEELLNDPQALHRQMLIEVESPIGKVKQVWTPIKLAGTPGQISKTAPVFGEDTQEVLTGLGYSMKEIEEITSTG